MKYLPFITGQYSTAPGLMPMQKQLTEADRLVFQVDDHYHSYLANKQKCREENIEKYSCTFRFRQETMRIVVEFIARKLQEEYPSCFEYDEGGETSYFSNALTGELLKWDSKRFELIDSAFESVWDAICSQVQEDLAICQLSDKGDWMAAIHLCAPNHWAPSEKIGKSFDLVHAPVPGMEKTILNYQKMLQSIVQKGPFTRFAWGISTDQRLNHHPESPPGLDANEWAGRKIDDAAKLYIRTERQNLLGFSDINAFLFTIRTYFYPVDELDLNEKKALWSAIRTMSAESLEYKGLTKVTGHLSKRLFEE